MAEDPWQLGDDNREPLAADRMEVETWPRNNFLLTALILAGLIVLIGLGFATGVVQ